MQSDAFSIGSKSNTNHSDSSLDLSPTLYNNTDYFTKANNDLLYSIQEHTCSSLCSSKRTTSSCSEMREGNNGEVLSDNKKEKIKNAVNKSEEMGGSYEEYNTPPKVISLDGSYIKKLLYAPTKKKPEDDFIYDEDSI